MILKATNTSPEKELAFPTIKEFPRGSQKKAWSPLRPPGLFAPLDKYALEGWLGPSGGNVDSRAMLNWFHTFQYALILFKQKPYSYLELHSIDPESEEGKAHLALWMKHRLEGE